MNERVGIAPWGRWRVGLWTLLAGLFGCSADTWEYCASGRCSLGQACTRSADCRGVGMSCWTDPPGGYCYADCRTNADCGPTGICYQPPADEGTEPYCLQRCAARSDCRNDQFYCRLLEGSQGGCFPSCATNPTFFCAQNLCSSSTGECSRNCAVGADCATGATCNTAVTPGRCDCTATTDCGQDGRCYPASGRCGCANDAYCGAGYSCNTATGACDRRT